MVEKFIYFFSTNYKPFIKYCIVGILGTLIDVGSLYFFVEYLAIPILIAAVISFILAVSNNFILNKVWTFEHLSRNYKKLYIKFFVVSLIALGLTLVSMYVLVFILTLWYVLAKIVTSLFVLIWNFLANKLWTFRYTISPLHKQDAFDYELSIIIPSYNEEKRLGRTLLAIKNYIEGHSLNAEVIVIDDGSDDRTRDVAQAFQKQINNLFLIRLPKNYGKGFAVKRGVEQARGAYVIFADADNATPIEELEKLMAVMHETGSHVVIGSRYLKDDSVKIQQPQYRIMIGRIGNLLIKTFLIDGIKDTQCGFKLFCHEAAKDIFRFQKVKRFGFDMELLVIAKNLGYKISEIPVSWFHVSGSRLRPLKDSLITIKDLLYTKLNLWLGRYDRD